MDKSADRGQEEEKRTGIYNQPAATAVHNSIMYSFDGKIRIDFTRFLKVISID